MASQEAFVVAGNWIKELPKYKLSKFGVKSALAIKIKVGQFYHDFMAFTTELKLPTGQAGKVCMCVCVWTLFTELFLLLFFCCVNKGNKGKSLKFHFGSVNDVLKL